MADPQHREVLAGALDIATYLELQPGESEEERFSLCERLIAQISNEEDRHRHVAGQVLTYMRTDNLYLSMGWTDKLMKQTEKPFQQKTRNYERRKERAHQRIQTAWGCSMEDALGELTPRKDSERVREALARLAEQVADPQTAKRRLQDQVNRRLDAQQAAGLKQAINCRVTGADVVHVLGEGSANRTRPSGADAPNRAPVSVPELDKVLRDELGRQHAQLDQRGWEPGSRWAHLCLERFGVIWGGARPARLYIEGTEPGQQMGAWTTATRDEADVLCLDEERTREEIRAGPPDGKPIFMRAARPPSGDDVATHLSRLTLRSDAEPVSVQLPSQPRDGDFAVLKTMSELAVMFRQILAGEAAMGYGKDELLPHNVLSLPSFEEGKPRYMSGIDPVSIFHFLCMMDSTHSVDDPEESRTFWLVCSHLAMSLPHQDHDGFGTHLQMRQGYKIWVFWPKNDDVQTGMERQGVNFAAEGARYVVLAPGDDFVMSPVNGQTAHAVLSLGFCGVTECTGDCVRRNELPCCGVVSADGGHYWHGHFLADSVRSITREMKWPDTTNQDARPDIQHRLEQVLDRITHDDGRLFGGAVRSQQTVAAIEVCPARFRVPF